MKKSNSHPLDRMYHMYKFRALMDRLTDEELKRSASLTQSQYFILLSLAQESVSSQKQIAFFLGISESAVSKQIQSLIDTGLITRTEHPEDKRTYDLSITPPGTVALTSASTALEKHYNHVFGKPSKVELFFMDTHMKKMLDKIEHFLHTKSI